ncbi:MAG: DegQ family serine endoprotease [Deltaproteobacteria bacterium]|nr:DegQ family serine endoprotease [Deltaproteobacteria bacterium]
MKRIFDKISGTLIIAAIILASILTGVGVSLPPEPAPDQDRGGRAQAALPSFVPLAQKLAPIVVNISSTQVITRGQNPPAPFGEDDPAAEFWRKFFGEPFEGPFRQRGLGSGVIIERDGTVLTNHHVVENAEKITVKLQDQREFQGKVIGRDPKTDIAVVKIDVKGDLPAATLGDSDRLEVGEWVVALGSPFGLDNTITAGIISAKGRRIGAGPYDDFIQTDASINPGNSGGPLINMRGEVVGINTAIFSRSGGNMGIGFAIPINRVKELLPELKSKGKVTRGWLGVAIQPVTPELAASLGMDRRRGALVASVVEDGPAKKAGIAVGDVIVEYDGKEIKDAGQLPILVARTKVGQRVQLKVLREKQEVPISVTIHELRDEEVVASKSKGKDFGLTVQQLTPQIARGMGLDRVDGVIISSVDPASPAAEAGFRRGDIILEVDRKPVRNLADYQNAIERAKDKSLLFLVRRGENSLFLALRTPE